MNLTTKGTRLTRMSATALIAAAAMAGAVPAAYAAPATSAAVAPVGATVTGTVSDNTGEPLIGATVTVKGTGQAVATDFDGNFTLTNVEGTTLVVTYIGFKPQEVAIDGRSHIDITLEENSEMLDEVVVVGYGTQKKATMTGAVTAVGAKQLENKGTLSSPVQALQGQVPGVIITRQSSAPGDESWGMSLRGAVSKNSSEPLIIIDGIEYESVNEL